ncbi:MAG: adenylate/guanylate cyclase domain-containing protein [Candidatus Kapaibacterium sp.]
MTHDELMHHLAASERAQKEGAYDESVRLATEVLAALNTGDPLPDMRSLHDSATLRTKALLCLVAARRAQGNFEESLTYAEEALAIAEEHTLTTQQANALAAIGIIYYKLSDFTRALHYYHHAMQLNEMLANKEGLAGIFNAIGILYSSLTQYDQSLEYLEKGCELYAALGHQLGLGATICAIGNIYLDKGDYHTALDYYRKALAISEAIGRKSGIAINSGNIGTIYEKLGEYSQAFDYYQQALTINRDIGAHEGIAGDLGNLASLYATEGFSGFSLAQAEELFLRVIEMDSRLGLKEHIIVQYQRLADVYARMERWRDAYECTTKYLALKEDVFSETVRREAQNLSAERKAAEREKQRLVAHAKHQATEQLLHNVLPPSIAAQMLTGSTLIAEKLPTVSVLFADIVNFTKLSQSITPEELVEGLDRIFSTFDALAEKHGLEKIKTIGDAYMVVSGAPIPRSDHAEAIAHFALDMVEAMKEFRSISTGEEIQVRIGIHSGEVVAGVIGKKKFAYDLWGDAVNTASRMESHGEAGRIHVSEEFKHAVETLHAPSLQFIRRGEIDIKGKGIMKTYFLEHL